MFLDLLSLPLPSLLPPFHHILVQFIQLDPSISFHLITCINLHISFLPVSLHFIVMPLFQPFFSCVTHLLNRLYLSFQLLFFLHYYPFSPYIFWHIFLPTYPLMFTSIPTTLFSYYSLLVLSFYLYSHSLSTLF